jgi:hypothetical protein
MKDFEASQGSEDWQMGWRYFLEKTKLTAGTDPAEATQLRQMELEMRESSWVKSESRKFESLQLHRHSNSPN